MAIISRQLGYVFIQVPRTGCTAIAEKVLVPELGGEHLPTQDLLAADGTVLVPWKHASLVRLMEHGLVTPGERDRLLVFATVRNPFDSVVSQYLKMRRSNARELERPNSWVHGHDRVAGSVSFALEHSFDEWVAWQYARLSRRRRLRRALNPRPKPPMYYRGVDVVMRFETLQADFDEVLARVGVAGTFPIPTHNRTPGREVGYREMYSRRSRAIVQGAFAGTIDQFGYEF